MYRNLSIFLLALTFISPNLCYAFFNDRVDRGANNRPPFKDPRRSSIGKFYMGGIFSAYSGSSPDIRSFGFSESVNQALQTKSGVQSGQKQSLSTGTFNGGSLLLGFSPKATKDILRLELEFQYYSYGSDFSFISESNKWTLGTADPATGVTSLSITNKNMIIMPRIVIQPFRYASWGVFFGAGYGIGVNRASLESGSQSLYSANSRVYAMEGLIGAYYNINDSLMLQTRLRYFQQKLANPNNSDTFSSNPISSILIKGGAMDIGILFKLN